MTRFRLRLASDLIKWPVPDTVVELKTLDQLLALYVRYKNEDKGVDGLILSQSEKTGEWELLVYDTFIE